MKKSGISKKRRLRELIERNYEEFKEMALKMDKESIFELAPTISAVEDVYHYMATHDWANAEETEYLLQQENPLCYLGDAWNEELEGMDKQFGLALSKAVVNGKHYCNMDTATVDELRKKYGAETPLFSAALIEIIELGKTYLGFCEKYGGGNGFDCGGEDGV